MNDKTIALIINGFYAAGSICFFLGTVISTWMVVRK